MFSQLLTYSLTCRIPLTYAYFRTHNRPIPLHTYTIDESVKSTMKHKLSQTNQNKQTLE